MEEIIIRDAYEHNLKHIDLSIPLRALTCVTGCSGCGKSSLVFDTIYAESQRGFLGGMTGNLYSQKLMDKPKVGSIRNLQPALNVSQNYYNVNPRSTVGTTTEIAYYLRSLFAIVNSSKTQSVDENIFSSNNPKSFCPNCTGLGIENVISEQILIPDSNKTLREGGIIFFKGSPDSKEQRMLEAFCEHYNIDASRKISELSDRELRLLMYADDKVRYKLSYKEGKRKKQHYVYLQGVIPMIKEKMSTSIISEQSGTYSRFMEEKTCHVCGGFKLDHSALAYKVGALNYGEVENLELKTLRSWLLEIEKSYSSTSKAELIAQLSGEMVHKIDSLISLNLGYLSLSRTIPSLSDGERQRVRIATQLTCSLRGLLYILDEPCKGLHYRDVGQIVQSTKDLVERGNTVIAIEHNKQYISMADYVVELGPAGGPEGGYLIGNNREVEPLSKDFGFKPPRQTDQYFEIENINFRNIKNQTAKFPIGGITCITGVSGSGKSTLAAVVAKCLGMRAHDVCDSFSGNGYIKRAVQVNQAPIGKTPRSTVVSYLGVFDEIRSLFAKTDSARKMKLNAAQFSMNVKGGRCECCQGTGLQKIELNYLPSSFIVCPECKGKRFNEEVLSVRYQGASIQDVLEMPVSDVIGLFDNSAKVHSVLSSMIELGLGYLQLGQMSMNLSGGEAQRIKLAKALGTPSHGSNLFILDEPTSGLNDLDIERFIKVLFSLQDKGDTIIAIEHNIEFVAAVADHIIDFGLLSGDAGGVISAQGTPEFVFKDESSSLYGLSNSAM